MKSTVLGLLLGAAVIATLEWVAEDETPNYKREIFQHVVVPCFVAKLYANGKIRNFDSDDYTNKLMNSARDDLMKYSGVIERRLLRELKTQPKEIRTQRYTTTALVCAASEETDLILGKYYQ